MKFLTSISRRGHISNAQPEEEPATGIEYERGNDVVLTFETNLHPQKGMVNMEYTSVIGDELEFKGDVVQHEGLRLDGKLDGRIQLSGNDSTLYIAKQAILVGEASAEAVEIHGNCDAQVQAAHVVIHDSAVTRGAVVYDQIEIKGGDNDINLRRRQASVSV